MDLYIKYTKQLYPNLCNAAKGLKKTKTKFNATKSYFFEMIKLIKLVSRLTKKTTKYATDQQQ